MQWELPNPIACQKQALTYRVEMSRGEAASQVGEEDRTMRAEALIYESIEPGLVRDLHAPVPWSRSLPHRKAAYNLVDIPDPTSRDSKVNNRRVKRHHWLSPSTWLLAGASPVPIGRQAVRFLHDQLSSMQAVLVS